jgi:hypothetical protein
MPGQTSITLSGLLQEIRDQFPSNPPRLGFVCLRHFDCCADVSRNQVPLALAEVIRSSGLPLDVHLTPVSNARECTRLILRVARALCDRRGARTDADFHLPSIDFSKIDFTRVTQAAGQALNDTYDAGVAIYAAVKAKGAANEFHTAVNAVAKAAQSDYGLVKEILPSISW